MKFLDFMFEIFDIEDKDLVERYQKLKEEK